MLRDLYTLPFHVLTYIFLNCGTRNTALPSILSFAGSCLLRCGKYSVYVRSRINAVFTFCCLPRVQPYPNNT